MSESDNVWVQLMSESHNIKKKVKKKKEISKNTKSAKKQTKSQKK